MKMADKRHPCRMPLTALGHAPKQPVNLKALLSCVCMPLTARSTPVSMPNSFAGLNTIFCCIRSKHLLYSSPKPAPLSPVALASYTMACSSAAASVLPLFDQNT